MAKNSRLARNLAPTGCQQVFSLLALTAAGSIAHAAGSGLTDSGQHRSCERRMTSGAAFVGTDHIVHVGLNIKGLDKENMSHLMENGFASAEEHAKNTDVRHRRWTQGHMTEVVIEADSVYFQVCSGGVERFWCGTSMELGVLPVGSDTSGRLKSGLRLRGI